MDARAAQRRRRVLSRSRIQRTASSKPPPGVTALPLTGRPASPLPHGHPTYLSAIRQTYDTIATDYAALVKSPAQLDPLSRAMLSAFAEETRSAGLGPVADLGCGPGKVTAHLADLGVPAFGVDLSPKMAELARQTYPGPHFVVGSMSALPLRDSTLGGILAYYSAHHTPPESLPTVFTEFHRTLAPGAPLMPAGHVGPDQHLRPTRGYGGPGLRRPPSLLRVLPASGPPPRRTAAPHRAHRHGPAPGGTPGRSNPVDRHHPGP